MRKGTRVEVRPGDGSLVSWSVGRWKQKSVGRIIYPDTANAAERETYRTIRR